MAKTAIDFVKEIADKFGVTGEKELHPRQKRAFVEAQAGEQKAIINRLIVDAATARFHASQAKDETTASAHESKANGYEGDIRQLVKTLEFYQELAKQLAEEHPEVKDVSAEHPDSF